MHNQGKFIIPEPCHEDWTQMTPVEQGRFCAACQKCVVDLTEKTPHQISEIYQANEGNVCGRMKLSQFGKQQSDPQTVQPRRTVLSKLQMFAAALVAAFFLGFSADATAQCKLPTDRPIKGKIRYVPKDAVIEGNVQWEYGNAATGATVTAKRGERLVAETKVDAHGHYRFEKLRPGTYTLTVSDYGIDVETREVYVNGRHLKQLDFVLEEVMIDGEIEWIEPEPPEAPEPQAIFADSETVELLEPIQPVVVEEPEMHMLGVIAFEPAVIEMPKDPVVVEDQPEALNAPEIPSDAPQTMDKHTTELAGAEITVFPNPTVDKVRVMVEGEEAAHIRMRLTDLNGRVLYGNAAVGRKSLTETIDLSGYAAGVYVLTVLIGEELMERRIIKE